MGQLFKFKYEAVADSLREGVRHGEYSTGRIPSESELMVRFKVGKITVYKALKLLVDEGVLKRVQGKGTFVNGVHGKSLTISGQVPVVMSHSGHYYSALAGHIRRFLYERDLFSIPMDHHQNNSNKLSKPAIKHLSLLLNSKIYGVIYDGNAYHERLFMNEYSHLRTVAVCSFDAPGEIPGSSVLVDFKMGASKTVEYLAGKGHRRIILLTHYPDFFPIQDPIHAARHPVTQTVAGYENSMNKLGLKEFCEVVVRDDKNVDDLIRGLLSRSERPDAIICGADIIALKVIMAAFTLGVRVPEDLSVVGMYNTPWTEESPVKITSVGFREELVAEKAVELLATETWEKRAIVIEPEIIERRSA